MIIYLVFYQDGEISKSLSINQSSNRQNVYQNTTLVERPHSVVVVGELLVVVVMGVAPLVGSPFPMGSVSGAESLLPSSNRASVIPLVTCPPLLGVVPGLLIATLVITVLGSMWLFFVGSNADTWRP